MDPSRQIAAAIEELAQQVERSAETARRHAEKAHVTATAWRDRAPAESELALVAVSLHHCYTAAEDAFDRIRRFTAGDSPSSERWHADLLDAMTLDLGDLRPPVLLTETADVLHRLLRFRHFLRNAYAVSLDRERLVRLADTARGAAALLGDDLARFVSYLRSARDSLRAGEP